MGNINEQDERAAFEDWIRTREGHPFAKQFSNLMWAAWQARAAMASAPVAGEAVGEIVLFGGELKEVSWRHGKMPPPGTKLYAAPQAIEAAIAAQQGEGE